MLRLWKRYGCHLSISDSSRRDFLKAASAADLALLAPLPDLARPGSAWPQLLQTPPGSGDAWAEAAAILARIVPPRFPARDFNIVAFGAVGDGAKDSTAAIRKAIAACAAAGGGRLLVPAGTFLTGAIHLKSRVNLHLSAGATLQFSRDPRQYLPLVFTRWEGVELMNYSAFIYAFEQENIAVTGPGTLDGNASEVHWWPLKGCDPKAPDAPNQLAARARTAAAERRGESRPVAATSHTTRAQARRAPVRWPPLPRTRCSLWVTGVSCRATRRR
jgi:hypothetical protein